MKPAEGPSTSHPNDIPPFELVNLVADIYLGYDVHLERLASELGVLYEPEFDRSVIIKRDGEPTLIIHRNGRLAVAGATSEGAARDSLTRFLGVLADIGYELPKEVAPRIVNMVAVTDFDTVIDLNTLAVADESIDYNPDIFPGAMLRPSKDKLVVMVYSTGKCVVTGASSFEQIRGALEGVGDLLQRIYGR